jgi:hypothetical protein
VKSVSLPLTGLRRRQLLDITLAAIFGGAVCSVASAQELAMDFSDPEVVRRLWVVNDGVMGGVSQSRFRYDAGGVIFEGEVSLRNNGGFASLRGPVAFAAGTTALALSTQGDGKRYSLLLRMDSARGAASYQCDFDAFSGISIVCDSFFRLVSHVPCRSHDGYHGNKYCRQDIVCMYCSLWGIYSLDSRIV